VRTGGPGQNWAQARKMMELAQFSIGLITGRVARGIGALDAPMPPLKQPKRKLRYSKSQQKMVEYGTADTGYPAFKRRLGLKPIRDLRGPGGLVVSYDSAANKRYRKSGTRLSRTAAAGHKGHMLDDIRVLSVRDAGFKIGISNSASRVKARANEQRGAWWGWSRRDIAELTRKSAEIFFMTATDVALSLGFAAARGVASGSRYLSRALRRAA
jgi:hypothetical protein